MSLEGSLAVETDADEVKFAFTIENTGEEDVTAQFSDGQTFDVAVTADGEEVWRYAEGMMFTQMLQEETYDADRRTTYVAEWEDPDPGEYEAEATLTATDVDCTATATFSV